MDKLNPEAVDQNNDEAKHDVAQCGCKGMHVMVVRGMIGIVIGGLAGLGLHYFVGCPAGTCPIVWSPWGSALYCAILGFVVSQIVRPCRVA